jgi:hypothetical protein
MIEHPWLNVYGDVVSNEMQEAIPRWYGLAEAKLICVFVSC